METKLIAITFMLQAVAILSLIYAVYKQGKKISNLEDIQKSLHLTQKCEYERIQYIMGWIECQRRLEDLAKAKEEYELIQKRKDIERQIIA